MLVRPPSLPRTLKGVGGIRLIDMPGVKYPESVIKGRKGVDTRSGKPHTEAPKWGICSRDAALLLGVSVRSARAMLNRQKSKYRLVTQAGSSACMYWDKRVVARMLARRMPLVRKVPEKLCNAKEACYILLVARSSLSRYVKTGLLKEYPVRLVTPSGVRSMSYFLRSDVRKLAAKRNAVRLRTEQMRREHLERAWNAQKLPENNR